MCRLKKKGKTVHKYHFVVKETGNPVIHDGEIVYVYAISKEIAKCLVPKADEDKIEVIDDGLMED